MLLLPTVQKVQFSAETLAAMKASPYALKFSIKENRLETWKLKVVHETLGSSKVLYNATIPGSKYQVMTDLMRALRGHLPIMFPARIASSLLRKNQFNTAELAPSAQGS